MASASIQITGNVAGIAVNGPVSKTGDGQIGLDPTIAAAIAGTLSTRTSDTAGTLTLTTGHGITDGETIDIYWSGGRAYSATVGVVAGDDVPFTLASGDVMPAQDTAVTAMVQQVIEFDVEGDDIDVLLMKLPTIGRVGFLDGVTEEVFIDLAAGQPWVWWEGLSTNPFATFSLSSIVVTQAGTSAQTFKLGALYDSTP